MSKELSGYHVPTVDWLAMLGLLLMTRLSWVPLYLGIDRVNLAYALDEFNPAFHQPQPPGYPLSVLFARLIDAVVHDPHTTFLVISIGISALSLPVLFALTSRMFSPSEARIAVFLLVLNPVFWSASLRSPLRPHLALFSLLIAYCCWRCIKGENRFAIWGALALSIGGGFRPDIVVYMSPLWVLSTWLGTRSVRALLRGSLVFGLCTLAWLVPTLLAAGGPGVYVDLIVDYLNQQAGGESVLLGASWRPWLHQMSRLVTWNGLAVAGWLLAVPIFLHSEGRIRLRSLEAGFIASWVAPGILIQALTHVAEPGHTLFSVAAFCLLGSHVLHCSIAHAAGARRYYP
ncbi:MAG: hypothetical protein HY646_14050, partial [Acidobacteria bacterium]|nr:hypothetical protein [Acidobacteriota bacterium]